MKPCLTWRPRLLELRLPATSKVGYLEPSPIWRPALHHACRQPVCQALVSEIPGYSSGFQSADVFQVSSSASGTYLRGGAAPFTGSAQSPSSFWGPGPLPSVPEVAQSCVFKGAELEAGASSGASSQDRARIIQAHPPEAGHESQQDTDAPCFRGCESRCGTVGGGVRVLNRVAVVQAGVKVLSSDPPKQVAPPGSRAPRVFPSDLWSKFFETLSRSDCSLSSFFHSIRLLPCGEQGLRQQPSCQSSGQVWPIPLPFPKLLKSGSSKVRDSVELGLNAVILILAVSGTAGIDFPRSSHGSRRASD